MRLSTIWLAAIVLLFMVTGGQAQTSCTVQVVVDGTVDSQGDKIHGTNWMAQTLMMPGAGCRKLDQITVRVCKGGDPANLVFEVHEAISGIPVPGSTPLASASLAGSSVGAMCGNGKSFSYESKTLSFTSPPSLTGGSTYAILAHQLDNQGSGDNYYRLGVRQDNPYSSGAYCKWNPALPGWDCPNGPGGGLDAVVSVCAEACPACTVCAYSHGYWKNHSSWPVTALTLGTISYNQVQLVSILSQPVQGNGLVSLAHQLIAAKLNQARGSCVPAGVSGALNDADTLIGSLVVPPVGFGYLATSSTSALSLLLDQYNNGAYPGGPVHCE